MTTSTTESVLAPPASPVASSAARQTLVAYACLIGAALTLTISVALARAGVTGNLAPADLLALRFGIGGLLFLPSLVSQIRSVPRKFLVAAVPLSFSHGWGMAGSSLIGLQFAPASHSGALGSGGVPLWVAVLGFLLYRQRTNPKQMIGIAVICAGASALLVASYRGISTERALQGDFFFVAASALAATYFLYVERHGLPARIGNALVMVLSAVVVVPAYLLFFESRLPTAPAREVAIQSIVQGVLMPLAYLGVHRAVLGLGSRRVAILMAVVPVMTIVTGHMIAGDSIGAMEAAAVVLVSTGVAVGAVLRERSS